MSPHELTSSERRRLLRWVIWRHSRPHLLFVAVLQGTLLLAKVGGGIWLPNRSDGAWMMDAYQSVGVILIAFLLAVALLRRRVAFIPLMKRLPILPADEYRARIEIASLCGSIVLGSIFLVELFCSSCGSAWPFLSRLAVFFFISLVLLSYGASLGWKRFKEPVAFLSQEFLLMLCVFKLFGWLWKGFLFTLYRYGHDVFFETCRQLRWPLTFFAIGWLFLVINWRRATHGSLISSRFARVKDVIYFLFCFVVILYLLRKHSLFAWLGKGWRIVQDPEGLSPIDLMGLMMYLWIFPLAGALVVAGLRARKWRRLDGLLSRLPVTPRTVARSRLGELVRLWGALILIPALLQLFFTHALARYPLEASVVSWEWLLALSLVVSANLVLTVVLFLVASTRFVVLAVWLLIFLPEVYAYSLVRLGSVRPGTWSGPLSVSLLAAVFTALGMWMTYLSIQRCMTPVRGAVPNPPGRTSPPAITAFQGIP